MFAQRLRELRKNKDITQIEFARQFNIATGTIGMWETGKRQPDYDTLLSIAKYFDVSVDYLLGKEDSPTLDEQLDGVDFALYGEIHDLTEEEKRDILSYVQFKKSQRGE